MPDRPEFLLHLVALPATVSPEQRVRQLLKYALRGLDLKCVRVEFPDAAAAELPGDQAQAVEAHQPASTARPRKRRKRKPQQGELFAGDVQTSAPAEKGTQP